MRVTLFVLLVLHSFEISEGQNGIWSWITNLRPGTEIGSSRPPTPGILDYLTGGGDIGVNKQQTGVDFVGNNVGVGSGRFVGALQSGLNRFWQADGGLDGGGFVKDTVIPVLGRSVFNGQRNVRWDQANWRLNTGRDIDVGPFAAWNNQKTLDLGILRNMFGDVLASKKPWPNSSFG